MSISKICENTGCSNEDSIPSAKKTASKNIVKKNCQKSTFAQQYFEEEEEEEDSIMSNSQDEDNQEKPYQDMKRSSRLDNS